MHRAIAVNGFIFYHEKLLRQQFKHGCFGKKTVGRTICRFSIEKGKDLAAVQLVKYCNCIVNIVLAAVFMEVRRNYM